MDEPSAAPPVQPADDSSAGPVDRSHLDSSGSDGSSGLAGMGATPSGPTFQPWPVANPTRGAFRPTEPLGSGPPERPDIDSVQPPASRLPAVLTVAVVLVMAAVVLAATLVAHRADRQASPPSAAVRPTGTVSSPSDDSIEFAGSNGSGRLVIRSHTWSTTGVRPPRSGTFLRVQVELVCTQGTIRYDPDLFQAFDATGEIFDVVHDADSAGQLPVGTLEREQTVRGSVTFDLPRGDATLLMTDDMTQSVTALKVPD